LMAFDDHLLADIGVSRDHIKNAVRTGKFTRQSGFPVGAA
jgi:uncharacterized protein YjiS (DUF1127 family)